MEASINALTAPTSRNISLLCGSALHDKLRKTLAVTYPKLNNNELNIHYTTRLIIVILNIKLK